MRLKATATSALLLFATPVFAEQSPPQTQKVVDPPTREEVAQEFDLADTNKNGLLEKAEWLKSLHDGAKPFANVVWSRIQPSGETSVSKQRYIEVHTSVS